MADQRKTAVDKKVNRLDVANAGNSERAIYNSLIAKYGSKVVTGSYLRFEVDLTATTGTIQFPVLVNDSPNANVNERRLNVGDAFMVTKAGFYLYKIATGVDRSTAILDTFPNPILYAKVGEAPNLMSLYNGFLNFTIDRNELIPAMDMMQFLNAGVAQQGVLTAASGTNNAYVRNQFLTGYGEVEMLPAVRLSGSLVNQITLSPAKPADMSGTASTNTAVLIVRGFLIQNGANFKDSR
jgi:hypothetical protein